MWTLHRDERYLGKGRSQIADDAIPSRPLAVCLSVYLSFPPISHILFAQAKKTGKGGIKVPILYPQQEVLRVSIARRSGSQQLHPP
ncbi:hypothetical protein MGYG_05901 [Nannizzia gypsea CBS 118893]|uniref:Uncharacterized protein n=1 Tax=Arthroderma gypseum (strain ATCC MYA-4604 / CBS 118893) TaxID=535722 RepID=E4UZW3_ARTGP|nr:hypothetical protein MGYG_05901 [Nannizzia gypsea CBS 118893]EFR02900.1 hypothetical protein MGYG_05901 [Nannizzia gypsea CBS 118893]